MSRQPATDDAIDDARESYWRRVENAREQAAIDRRNEEMKSCLIFAVLVIAFLGVSILLTLGLMALFAHFINTGFTF